MNTLVFGAGAIGAYLGARLSQQGHHVAFVGRRAFVEAFRARGLEIRWRAQGSEPTGSEMVWRVRDVRAAETPEDFGDTAFDACLVCVKAYAVDDAIAALRGCADRQRQLPFVTFQNGIGSEERFAAAFGEERVIAGTTTMPVSRVDEAVFRAERRTGGEGFALVSQSQAPQASLYQTATTMMTLRAAYSAQLYNDFRAMKWSKLLLNVVGNASGAILDMSTADIYHDRRLFKLELGMLREVLAVMRALKLDPLNLPGAPAAMLAAAIRGVPEPLLQPLLARFVARGRGDKRPSLYYDVANRTGRSEVAWMNGAVVEHGTAHGLQTPVNRRLTDVLTRIVGGQEPADLWRRQVDRLVGG